jgi:hypothetical protein
MRDLEVIDSELRLLAALRRAVQRPEMNSPPTACLTRPNAIRAASAESYSSGLAAWSWPSDQPIGSLLDVTASATGLESGLG